MPWRICGGQGSTSQLAELGSLLASCGNEGSNADRLFSSDGIGAFRC